jgi:hypothetical protein
VRGRELTLLGKWAIFFGNYLFVKYRGINTEYMGERVEVAVYGSSCYPIKVNMSGRGKSLVMWI